MNKATDISNWYTAEKPDRSVNKTIVAALMADEAHSSIADSSGRYYLVLCPAEDGVNWDRDEPLEGQGPYPPESIVAWFDLKASVEKWQPVSTSPFELAFHNDPMWKNHRILAKYASSLIATGEPVDCFKVLKLDHPEFDGPRWLDDYAEPFDLNEYQHWLLFQLPDQAPPKMP